MGNAAADEHQPAGYDVSADDATRNAGKEASQQGMLEKGIIEQFEYIVHRFLMNGSPFSDNQEKLVFQFVR